MKMAISSFSWQLQSHFTFPLPLSKFLKTMNFISIRFQLFIYVFFSQRVCFEEKRIVFKTMYFLSYIRTFDCAWTRSIHKRGCDLSQFASFATIIFNLPPLGSPAIDWLGGARRNAPPNAGLLKMGHCSMERREAVNMLHPWQLGNWRVSETLTLNHRPGIG